MEIFEKARVVRLRSHHDKYLSAENDEEGVCQDRNGSVPNARWEVEVLENVGGLRLKSCYGKYLSASNMPLFLGVTGKKVLQTLPRRLDSSLEWEPIREGIQVKLRTRYGLYLRANGGVPPWRNSVTHDIPHRSATQDWILWEVDVLEHQTPPPSPSSGPSPVLVRTATPQPLQFVEWRRHQSPSGIPSPTSIPLMSPGNEVDDSLSTLLLKDEGRLIIYEVIDDKGNVDKSKGQLSFLFKGTGVEQLKQKLKQETGLNDILVCSENPLNGKLCPIRLHLPPNKAKLNLVVVPSTSALAKEFNK